MNKETNIQTLYRCPDGIVTIIRKSSGLGRFPDHDYPCILLQLVPCRGTRVRPHGDGGVEYLASVNELRAWLTAIDPALGKALPAWLRNKPKHRKEFFDRLNAERHRAKRQR